MEHIPYHVEVQLKLLGGQKTREKLREKLLRVWIPMRTTIPCPYFGMTPICTTLQYVVTSNLVP